MMKFKSVTFEDSLFKNCVFEDITSLNTYFRNCTFVNTTFYNTGIMRKYSEHPLFSCLFASYVYNFWIYSKAYKKASCRE